jgi:Domain of Unknown Function (DUF1080).
MIKLGRGTWIVAALALSSPGAAEPTGRWNLQVEGGGFSFPGWLGIAQEGGETSVKYVGRVGSARTIREFELKDGTLEFTRDEWFGAYEKVRHVFHLSATGVTGEITRANGQKLSVSGGPSPKLDRAPVQTWSEPRALFNGRDLSGWREIKGDKPPKADWRIERGELITVKGTADLATEELFEDFRLRLEFNCPPNGNSGVYLRGRYEVQIEDDSPQAPVTNQTGGVYGWLGPDQAVPRIPGEWQTLEITLVGRRATVVLNGRALYAQREIPAITGAALDGEEEKPGPILLQSSHSKTGGAIRFRNITIATPLTR